MRRYIMIGVKKRSLVVVLMFVLVLTAPIWAANQEAKVVSTQWLKNNLSRPDIRIVDMRNSVTDYWQSHIPGAVYMHPEVMRLADRGVPVKLMPPEALVVILGEMGIDPNTMLVVYTETGDFKGPYLVWALDYLGHQRAAILEGGFTKWQKEGLPVTQDYPEIVAKKYPLPKTLHHALRASLDEVKKVVASGGALILDVRPVELYTGEKGPWKRKGHIKGSLSRFWGEDLTTDGMWKDKAELKAAYEKLGVTPDKHIITSCGQGQMSAHTYVTLKYLLGYPNVRNYDGSFNEWSNIKDLPVETGMTP
jgi:thiosulfate/3-mercaptopyruvate sulfurtransferase